jgi:hypothetical protein
MMEERGARDGRFSSFNFLSGAKPMDERHLELQQIVIEQQPALVARWARRRRDDDILVLGDPRRPEVREMAVHQLGAAEVGRVIRESERAGRRPIVVVLQPARFIDLLARSADFAHRETAKELRGFARGGFALPLLVLTPGGIWATCWSPDDGTVILRYDPSPDNPPEAN